MKIIKILSIIAGVLFSILIFRTCNFFTSSAIDAAKQEFSPKEILRKYEWFKDASSQLDRKQKDISIMEINIQQMVEDYGDTPRKDWDRTDKEQLNQWRTELVGVESSYNDLAAEYNSQSSKFNWNSFEGDIPLEYRVYSEGK